MIWLVALGLLGAEDGPLNLADLADYQAALTRPAGEQAVAVTFRELWDRPDAYRGRLVRVEGMVARSFGSSGSSAHLASKSAQSQRLQEHWIVSDAGDPFCVVHPLGPQEGGRTSGLGSRVRFEGTFLRQVRYRGGDGDRLAPLIVGRDRLMTIRAQTLLQDGHLGRSRLDWGVGLAVAGVVAVILLTLHARRPRRRRIGGESIPLFQDQIEATDEHS